MVLMYEVDYFWAQRAFWNPWIGRNTSGLFSLLQVVNT